MIKEINRCLWIFIFCFAASLSFAQETTYVEYANGDVVEVEIKGFHSMDKKIKFKNLETGKKEKVASEELSSITFIHNEDTLVFRKMKVKDRLGKIFDSVDPLSPEIVLYF